MNIFYLDSTPELCARYHCDKHVIKMILETAQILSTVINGKLGEQPLLYKSTHKHHPCVLWAGETQANFNWLLQLLYELNAEYKYRWNRRSDHNSFIVIQHYIETNGGAIPLISDNWHLTFPALAMPKFCKVENNAVASYRNYYNLEKKHIHKWTNREIPEWII